MRRLLAVFCLLLIVPASGHAAPAPRANASAQERSVVTVLNEVRRAHRLPALRLAPSLVLAAREHSRDMVRRGYFGHGSASGQSFHRRVRRFHRSPVVAETIGWGCGAAGAPASIVRAWLRSPAHRAIILDRGLRVVGVGRAAGRFLGNRGASVYTADFAAGS
jgi:uncharacterized protein YkwD